MLRLSPVYKLNEKKMPFLLLRENQLKGLNIGTDRLRRCVSNACVLGLVASVESDSLRGVMTAPIHVLASTHRRLLQGAKEHHGSDEELIGRGGEYLPGRVRRSAGPGFRRGTCHRRGTKSCVSTCEGSSGPQHPWLLALAR